VRPKYPVRVATTGSVATYVYVCVTAVTAVGAVLNDNTAEVVAAAGVNEYVAVPVAPVTIGVITVVETTAGVCASRNCYRLVH
jgi:hypothetical protein